MRVERPETVAVASSKRQRRFTAELGASRPDKVRPLQRNIVAASALNHNTRTPPGTAPPSLNSQLSTLNFSASPAAACAPGSDPATPPHVHTLRRQSPCPFLKHAWERRKGGSRRTSLRRAHPADRSRSRGSAENGSARRRAALVLAGGGIKFDDAALFSRTHDRCRHDVDGRNAVVDRQDRTRRAGQRAKQTGRRGTWRVRDVLTVGRSVPAAMTDDEQSVRTRRGPPPWRERRRFRSAAPAARGRTRPPWRSMAACGFEICAAPARNDTSRCSP